jgi:amidohydrolase
MATGVGTLEAVDTTVAEIAPELEQVGREIHAHPELGFQEVQAAGLLCDLLERHGFAVQRGIAGMATAFEATAAAGTGPTIAVVAEYDALAGIGHACGHNLIATGAVGAGVGALRVLRQLGKGTVKVLGSPAEEGGGGKITLIEQGVFEGIDAAVMFHPSTRTAVTHYALANSRLTFVFHGKATHAAAAPERGINALDAFVLAYNGISVLRQHVEEGTRMHGILQEGGTAPNVIPDRTSGLFSIRARDARYLRKTLMPRVEQIFQAAAAATGCTVELSWTRPYLNAINNRTIGGVMRRHLEALGLEVEEPEPWVRAGSSDAGNMSQVLPSMHAYVAIAGSEVSGHSVEFREAANQERGYQAMLIAAKGLGRTVVELATEPGLLERARQEFETWRQGQQSVR